MFETELKLKPTESVNVAKTQLCILEVITTSSNANYQSSETAPVITVDYVNKKIELQIELLNGNESIIRHSIPLQDFPFENAVWNVAIDYQEKGKDKKEDKEVKTVQMEINVEPKPATDQFVIS